MKSRWVQEMEEEEFRDFYDPEEEDLEPMNLRRKPDKQIDEMIG